MNKNLEQATKEFIENYPHIYYCEVVIKPNGEIVEAIPSHQECLIRLFGVPREELREMIPFSDSPIAWLIRKTECVSVWYASQMLPFEEITKEQEYVLNELEKHGKIKINTTTARIQEDVLAMLETL